MNVKIPAYHVDAFAGAVFAGNPAMVCALESWPADATLQLIARENALPVTAFFVAAVAAEEPWELRWFTPTVELDLCGHGTIAAASVVFASRPGRDAIAFRTQSGIVHVGQDGPLIQIDFPVYAASPCAAPPEGLVRALGREPKVILKAVKYLAVYESEAEIRALAPDFARLREVEASGVIVTAKGEAADFVSRYFAPRIGIAEDAATGSTHCTLAPYWAAVLGLRKLHALQLSERGGEMWCEMLDDGRVRISARAVRYAEGFLSV
jgi:PhzF family phenazine biosynthesis protein